MVDWGIACLLAVGPKSVARTMDAANCAAVLLSVPISHHFHGCTALLVALVVVSGAIHTFTFLPFTVTIKSASRCLVDNHSAVQ